MEDVPQPAAEPYSPGDHVQVYLDENDPDAEHHGRCCIVINVLADQLAQESGRPLDNYSYRLKDAESGEELPVTFRHRDLVPSVRSN